MRNILASASADCSVCVWDMAWPKCVLTLPHPDKVRRETLSVASGSQSSFPLTTGAVCSVASLPA